MADPAYAAAFARDDGLDAVSARLGVQPIGFVALVGTQAVDPAGRLGQPRRGDRHVAGVAGRQQEDAGTVEDIGDRVDFGRLATARRDDGLRPRPFCRHGQTLEPGCRCCRSQPHRQPPGLGQRGHIAFQKPRRDQWLNLL